MSSKSSQLHTNISDCFLDSLFVSLHGLKVHKIAPLSLILPDGTSNNIVRHVVTLPIKLPCRTLFKYNFFITKPGEDCSLVLGYNWLFCYNPSINWQQGHLCINSTTNDQELLKISKPNFTEPNTSSYTNKSTILPNPAPSITPNAPQPPLLGPRPKISLVNAVAFQQVYRGGILLFRFSPIDIETPKDQASPVVEKDIDLS